LKSNIYDETQQINESAKHRKVSANVNISAHNSTRFDLNNQSHFIDVDIRQSTSSFLFNQSTNYSVKSTRN